MAPIISGTMIMFLKCVLIVSGLSHPLHLSLRLAELLHQRQRFAAETSAESTSLASAKEFDQVVRFQFEELFEVDAAVGELLNAFSSFWTGR